MSVVKESLRVINPHTWPSIQAVKLQPIIQQRPLSQNRICGLASYFYEQETSLKTLKISLEKVDLSAWIASSHIFRWTIRYYQWIGQIRVMLGVCEPKSSTQLLYLHEQFSALRVLKSFNTVQSTNSHINAKLNGSYSQYLTLLLACFSFSV